MIGVIDSKICNIFSLTNMLKKLKADFIVVTEPKQLESIDKIILPGVGAYPKAIETLDKYGLKEPIIDLAHKGTPVLGICLGMQLLFEESVEFNSTKGLGLIPGKIIKIETDKVLPHMGWNNLTITQDIPLLKGVENNADVYYVHTYRAETEDKYIAAKSEYDEEIPGVVCNGHIFGTQFHPEKSMKWGELILKNFIDF